MIAERPDLTSELCRLHKPQVLFMEVTGYTPRMLSERLSVRDKVREDIPACRIILTVEERADKQLASEAATAKRNGLVDEFLFLSMTDKYLPALLESL